MQRFIDFITNIWAKCNNSIALKFVFIILSILIAGAIITLSVYYWWIGVLIAGVVIWIYKENRNYQAMEAQRKQQLIEDLSLSVPYIMRQALKGLEPYFGLPNIDSKGLDKANIKRTREGIIFVELIYLRLPNLAESDSRNCSQFRDMLNSNIASVMSALIYDVPRPESLYVSQIVTHDGKIAIYSVPVIDVLSRKAVRVHKAKSLKQLSIGNTAVNTKNTHMELKDDEL